MSSTRADGARAGVADAADGAAAKARVVILGNLVDVGLVALDGQTVHVVVVVAVLGSTVDEHLLDARALLAGKVVLQGVPELLARDNALLVDELLDGGKAVCHVGDAHLQAADEVVDGAALLDGLATGDAVVSEG